MADMKMESFDGNLGNDMGMSTVGYRSAKYNPMEWQDGNYARYYQSFAGRDEADKLNAGVGESIGRQLSAAKKMQTENTKRLTDRVKDINGWKTELERGIKDMISETGELCKLKNRLESSLRSLEIPHHIVLDNLNCRQRRQGIDHVQDDVELALLKEIETINSAEELLRRTIREAEIQIKRNRDQKQNLEFDWSDKKEAKELDDFCSKLRNEHTCKQFYPGAARFQEIQSTPESWAQFSLDNLERAEQERLASVQLRSLGDNIINDFTSDVRRRADATDDAFRRRIAELEDARGRLEDDIEKTCKSIDDVEKNIAHILKVMRDNEDPMKVAQTRLHYREFRPRVELCRDPAQFGLIEEVNFLAMSMDELRRHLAEMEDTLKKLQDRKLALEKDLSIKKNSIFIDRDKCLPFRTRYPSLSKLQGY